MIEATVESIRVSMATQNRVVILKENGGTRHLPIWIGAYEAEAIALELQGVSPSRPLPYDLMSTIIEELNADVDRIEITDLSHKVYYATIVLVAGERTIEIDARPSDALALAIRCDARILIDDTVMERASISVGDEDEPDRDSITSDLSEPTSDSSAVDLDIFRDFINSLDLEDFDAGS